MGVIGYGTTVKLGASDVIGKLTKVSVSGQSRDTIDVSSADSTSMVKEILGGIVKSGKATFTCRMSPAGAALLRAHFVAGAVEDCLITFHDASTLTAGGFVSGLDTADVSYDGDITQSFTFTANELWTYA